MGVICAAGSGWSYVTFTRYPSAHLFELFNSFSFPPVLLSNSKTTIHIPIKLSAETGASSAHLLHSHFHLWFQQKLHQDVVKDEKVQSSQAEEPVICFHILLEHSTAAAL